MSELKCPICNTNLEVLVGGANALLGCPRCRDKATDGVWQELIRTRKALDVAVDALKKYTDASGNWWYGYEFQGHYEDYAGEYADKAIEQITALEQKD